jgi:RNA polymerase sigma-54 factor
VKPALGLRTSQQLALTPQLQQSIRLLQLSTQELNQEIEALLADNPLLELEDENDDLGDPQLLSAGPEAPDSDEGLEGEPSSVSDDQPTDWEGDGSVEFDVNATDFGCEAGSNAAQNERESGAGDASFAAPSLEQHLLSQASALRLPAAERVCLLFAIQNLDENGFLTDSSDALFADVVAAMGDQAETDGFELWEGAWATALALLRSFDPVGVGACDAWASLRLQARAKERRGEWTSAATADVLSLLDCPPMWLAKRDVKRVQQQTGCSALQVESAFARLRTLNPRPAREFGEAAASVVVPDVIVSRSGRAWRVEINPSVVPRLRVNASMLGADSAASPLSSKLQEARWFAKSVAQRFETIARVSAAIVERQKSFLVHGPVAMRPLVLRDIADALGLHESTVSRVTTAKFMATPQGTFEFKYFFASSLSTERGASASSTAVKALIQQMVDGEDSKRPLSDNDIALQLKTNGVNCARRTVAKYREALRIPAATLRQA